MLLALADEGMTLLDLSWATGVSSADLRAALRRMPNLRALCLQHFGSGGGAHLDAATLRMLGGWCPRLVLLRLGGCGASAVAADVLPELLPRIESACEVADSWEEDLGEGNGCVAEDGDDAVEEGQSGEGGTEGAGDVGEASLRGSDGGSEVVPGASACGSSGNGGCSRPDSPGLGCGGQLGRQRLLGAGGCTANGCGAALLRACAGRGVTCSALRGGGGTRALRWRGVLLWLDGPAGNARDPATGCPREEAPATLTGTSQECTEYTRCKC